MWERISSCVAFSTMPMAIVLAAVLVLHSGTICLFIHEFFCAGSFLPMPLQVLVGKFVVATRSSCHQNGTHKCTREQSG